MQILIVSATYLEIKNLIYNLNFTKISSTLYRKQSKSNTFDILITGIGIAFTVYSLTKALNKKSYNLVINAGIAGSLNNNLQIGDVVQVSTEEFADLGIRSPGGFSTLFEMNFMDKNELPFTGSILINPSTKTGIFNDLSGVAGITVNMVNGNKQEIKKLKQKFRADIESMEGAAVFYVCLMEKIPFAEIRSISNKVAERNKENWNILLAINNLTEVLKNAFMAF